MKLWYVAPMFRYARAQRGRYREHWQFGVESLGLRRPGGRRRGDRAAGRLVRASSACSTGSSWSSTRSATAPAGRPIARCSWPTSSASAASSRRTRRRASTSTRCASSTPRTRATSRIVSGAPRITDHLCAACAEHFAGVRAFLDARGVAYRVTPELVRGHRLLRAHRLGVGHPGRRLAGRDDLGRRPLRRAGRADRRRARARRRLRLRHRARRARARGRRRRARRRPSWTGSAPARTTPRGRSCTRCSSRRARAGLRAQADLAGRSLKGQLRHAERLRRARRHRLPRRRRRAWHRQARRGRDRVRRCRGLRRAERARTRERLPGHAVR